MLNGLKKPKVNPKSKSQTKMKILAKEKSVINKFSSKVGNSDVIISISTIALLLACVTVAGSTIYDKKSADNNQPAIAYGDTVGIKYVGSLHTYYDRYENPTIFATNIKSVAMANKENQYLIQDWHEYDSKYNVRDIVVGSKQLPEAIEKAIIGHHSGDTVELAIDSDSAHSFTSKVENLKKNYDYSIDKVKIFTSNSDFKAFFGIDAPETFFTVKSPYGWNANVVRNLNNLIEVEYSPEDSKNYDSGTGTTYKVSKVTNGKIVFQYDFSCNDRAIQAVNPQGEKVVYINEQVSDNEYNYKTENSQIAGETLYFTIKICQLETKQTYHDGHESETSNPQRLQNEL